MMAGKIHNRDQFLHRIAQRLGRNETNLTLARPKWQHHPQDQVLKGASLDDLLEVLKEQCKNIHTNILTVNLSELPQALNRVISQFGGGPIITWKDSRFEQWGISPLLDQDENLEVHVWDSSLGEKNIQMAEKANIGITISDITLAESATAVLFSSKDKGRSISFLPSNSIIIIPKSTIVPRMTQAAKLIQEKADSGELIASCINFISGPSNSADIEMNLVVGVHGPIKATYIVVENK